MSVARQLYDSDIEDWLKSEVSLQTIFDRKPTESLDTYSDSYLDSYFWPRFRRKLRLLERTQNENCNDMVETPPQQRHTERLQRKPRTSYLAPSAQGTVQVIIRLEPELKEALDKAVDESHLTQKEFLTAAIKKAVQGHTTESDPLTAKMTEEALEKSRELENILRRVNTSLSHRSL